MNGYLAVNAATVYAVCAESFRRTLNFLRNYIWWIRAWWPRQEVVWVVSFQWPRRDLMWDILLIDGFEALSAARAGVQDVVGG